MLRVALLVLLWLAAALPASAASRYGGTPVPPAALSAGYLTNTFHTGPFTTSNTDTLQTGNPGFQWYACNWIGQGADSVHMTLNADGSVSTYADPASPGGFNGSLCGAVGIDSLTNYYGMAFGGGAYFEAKISFNPGAVDTRYGWPAWWSFALEHEINTDQWPGQVTGYRHWMEADFFEYLPIGGFPNSWAATGHDWYGNYGVTCTGYCNYQTPNPTVYAPKGFDWTIYHRVGFLWVPATGSANGKQCWYLDDILVRPCTTYTQYVGSATTPPPGSGVPWTFGVMDVNHMMLQLSSTITPINVLSVDVWQLNSSGNIHNP